MIDGQPAVGAASLTADQQSILQLVRLGCRMRNFLARVAADESIQHVYRRQAAQCILALEQSADWIYTGLGPPPPIWEATKWDELARAAEAAPRPAPIRLRGVGRVPRSTNHEMRERIEAIRLLLLASGPASIREIGSATGLNWPTVRNLLTRLPTLKHGTWPARYSLATAGEPSPSAASA